MIKRRFRLFTISPLARREAMVFYLCVAPWVIGFLVFLAYPMLRSLYLSFTYYQLGIEPVWVGTNNFSKMWSDPDIRKSLEVTFLYALGNVPGTNILALLVALVLAQDLPGVNIWRTLFFLPTVVSAVAAAVLWLYIFNPEIGLLNSILALFGIEGPGWITNQYWALPSMIIVSWWYLGSQMVIYLAGLKGIPKVLYEAAEIDGAGMWGRFRHVTLPMLSPTVFFNMVLGIIGALQVFDLALVLTDGGPNKATQTFVYWLYQEAFVSGNMGYASAMAWLLFVIIMLFTLLVIRSSSLWVYYEAEQK